MHISKNPEAYLALSYMSQLKLSQGWSLEDSTISNPVKKMIIELSERFGLFHETGPRIVEITDKGRELIDYIQNHSGLKRRATEAVLENVFKLRGDHLKTLRQQADAI
ncbi:MAG: hypothetical protein KGH60_02345 [Candidatus Micrarchaeota archaeon]|nr:hypothetical protein [Candidatus Micrarchaeota archaeon]